MVALPPAARQDALVAAQAGLMQRYSHEIDILRMQHEEDFLATNCAEANNLHGDLPLYLRIRAADAQREFDAYDQYVRDSTLHNHMCTRIKSQLRSPFAARPTLHDRFELLELLGASSSGIELWKATDLLTGTLVTLKVSSDERMLTYDHKALARCDSHQYLVRLCSDMGVMRCVYAGHPYALYATEFVEEDLQTHLFRRPGGRLIEVQAQTIAFKVAQFIQFLQNDSKVAHCDIRPANILLNTISLDIRVTNLKSSRSRRERAPTIPHHLVKVMDSAQLLYAPPESFFCLERYGNMVECGAADVWALGVLYFFMLYGHHPLEPGLVLLTDDLKLAFVEQLRQFDQVEFPATPPVSPAIQATIRACLQKNPSERMASNILVTRGFF
ncbi:Aste57867_13965 [Aphanomyces stellatus]|uniref:Aste57867_13965 protein n=1 Tax=Aphanomyces stellatus TaxID=120398 RepID=A0A485L030_9STRA|nr:hypothetical protein As57867_013914 [Aphanomyces stellatus]VFT90795.1 Aste57867_13965 [Aphanomyces stellatus]